jgi:hypothetical protein
MLIDPVTGEISGSAAPGIYKVCFQSGCVDILVDSGLERPEGVPVIVSGALPPGMYVLADGSVRGVPTRAGRYDFVVCVGDSCRRHIIEIGQSWEEAVIQTMAGNSVVIALGEGRVVSASGSGIVSGALPPGMYVDEAAGVITGVPTQPGTYRFVYCAGSGVCREYVIYVRSRVPTYTLGEIWPVLVKYGVESAGGWIWAKRASWRSRDIAFIGTVASQAGAYDSLSMWGFGADSAGNPSFRDAKLLGAGELSQNDLSADDWVLAGQNNFVVAEALREVVPFSNLNTASTGGRWGNGRQVIVDLSEIRVNIGS